MLLLSGKATLMTLQCSSVRVEGILAIFRKMHCYFFALCYVLSLAAISNYCPSWFEEKKTLLSYNRQRVNCTYLKYTIWYVLMYIYIYIHTHVNINTVNSTNITLQRRLLHSSAISPSLHPSTQETTDLFFSYVILYFLKIYTNEIKQCIPILSGSFLIFISCINNWFVFIDLFFLIDSFSSQ